MNARLCRCIDRPAHKRDLTKGGPNIDNFPTTLRDHNSGHGLGGKEQRFQTRIQGLVPFLFCNLQRFYGIGPCRVVDQDVNFFERLMHLANHCTNLRHIYEVLGDHQGFTIQCLNL